MTVPVCLGAVVEAVSGHLNWIGLLEYGQHSVNESGDEVGDGHAMLGGGAQDLAVAVAADLHGVGELVSPLVGIGGQGFFEALDVEGRFLAVGGKA